MAFTYGFIGSGNMGSALFRGLLDANPHLKDSIIISGTNQERLEALHQELGIAVTTNNRDVVTGTKVVILAVKPTMYSTVIRHVSDSVSDDTIIVAIAAGQTHAMILDTFGRQVKVVRAMPNTPAQVKEGVTAISPNQFVTDEDLATVMELFNAVGSAHVIDEALFDAFTGVAGSSPAYAYLFIEAMADAGVKYGLPRDLSYAFSAQALLGAAKMVLETQEHPGKLKDNVCSPGGATIEAVSALESHGFRAAVIAAVDACVHKSKAMVK